MVKLIHVEADPQIEEVRKLFLEYATSLNFNLCFQSFDKELKGLPGEYAMPDGRLILCEFDGRPAGCIAFRRLTADVCEMKRLFVRPEFRGHQLGRTLALHAIEGARRAGYKGMRLETIVGAMDQAIALYRQLGFREIPAYYDNRIPNAVYMELKIG